MIKLHCDLCDEVIKENEPRYAIKVMYKEYDAQPWIESKWMDYCDSCFRERDEFEILRLEQNPEL